MSARWKALSRKNDHDRDHHHHHQSRTTRGGSIIKGNPSSSSTMSNTAVIGNSSAHHNNNNKDEMLLQSEDNYLQSEYITNLQQQIYFLELELQVMKEKANNGRFAGKAMNTNAPLDTHMNSLRDKYQSMERKYKKKLRKLEEENEILKSTNKDLLLKNNKINEKLDLFNEQISQFDIEKQSIKNSFVQERLRLTNINEKNQEKLKEKCDLIELINEKFRSFRIKSRILEDELKDEITLLKKLKNKLEFDNKQYLLDKKQCEIETEETKELLTLKNEDILIYKKQILNLNNDIRNLEHKSKKLEMDLEQSAELNQRYDEQLKQQRNNNGILEDKLKDEMKKISDMNRSSDRWSSKIIDYKNEINSLNETMKTMRDDNTKIQHELRSYIDEQIRLQELNQDLNDKLLQSNEQCLLIENKMKKLDELNLDLKKDNIIKSDMYDKLFNERSLNDTQLKQLLNDKEYLEIQLQQCKDKLAVSQQLEQIDLDEFQSLCTSNLKVADSIRVLMDAIHNKPVGFGAVASSVSASNAAAAAVANGERGGGGSSSSSVISSSNLSAAAKSKSASSTHSSRAASQQLSP